MFQKYSSKNIVLLAASVATLAGAPSASAAPISTNLQLHYNAGAGVASDTAGATPATNNGTVGQWADQATGGGQGGAQNATQSDSAKAATYIASNAAFNNQPTLRFNSIGSGISPLAFMPTSVPLNDSFTMFVVASVPNTTQTTTLLSNARPTSMTSGQWVFMTETNVLRFRSNGTQEAQATGYSANQPFIATAWSPATGEVRASLNGGAARINTSQNTSQFAGAANIGIGGVDSAANPPRTMNGDIAEVLIYNSSLSDADRQATLDYLGQKYGITVVPEPAGLTAVAGAAGLLLARRRRCV